MENKKIIYVADDETNIREPIKTFLENDGFEVQIFENGDNLLERFKEKESDLVILDIMMPGSNGLVICSELRKISKVPIIMLTARDSDLDYATGLSLGSDDYITKPFSPVSLVMRVKAIFRRIEFDKESISESGKKELTFGNINIFKESKIVKIENKTVSLTPNEYNLILYMFENQNKAISREEILSHVWNYMCEVETRAVDDTVRRLRKKIDKSNVLIDNVWGFGFRLKLR